MTDSHPKRIVITGASSGLGEALALAYAGPGVFLALTGRSSQRLDGVAKACEDKGATVVAKTISVTDKEDMATWLTGLDKASPLDLVIANAGVSSGRTEASEPQDAAREIFAVNLYGVMNTLDPVLPAMAARGKGQVAIVASLAGYRGMGSAPAYCASKAAVKVWGEGLRGRLDPKGVKVSVICPGFVRSRITDLNDFPMPFFMEADKAAHSIQTGLRKNKGRIAFPWPMALSMWFLSALPNGLAERLTKDLPQKE